MKLELKLELGRRLTIAREAIGISKKEVGLRCGWEGVNPSSRIAGYEKGDREPSLSDIVLLSEALNVSAQWLIFGEGKGPVQKNPDFKTLSTYTFKKINVKKKPKIKEFEHDPY